MRCVRILRTWPSRMRRIIIIMETLDLLPLLVYLCEKKAGEKKREDPPKERLKIILESPFRIQSVFVSYKDSLS